MQIEISGYGHSERSFRTLRLRNYLDVGFFGLREGAIEFDDSTGRPPVDAVSVRMATNKVNEQARTTEVEVLLWDMSAVEAVRLATALVEFAASHPKGKEPPEVLPDVISRLDQTVAELKVARLAAGDHG